MEEHDELERVPWSDLMAETEPEDRRRRMLFMVAGAIGAVAVGMIVARSWWGTPPTPAPVAPATSTTVLAEEAAVTVPSVIELPLYSEADLMADPPDPGERAAVTRAEWFVSDFFTADLEPNGSSDVRAALPPQVSQEVPFEPGDSVSYVEWARAFSVEEAGDGVYRVSVAFRSLGAPPDRGFSRQPVRAVAVLVQVNADGGSAVVDLPSPIALPIGPEPIVWDGEVVSPPQGVVDLVAARASAWGSEPRIISASERDGEWRVVVSLTDGVGARWPLVLRVILGGE